ncbi:MAG: hypothetical protein Tsb0020_19850 [Haliangiales bacterium]
MPGRDETVKQTVSARLREVYDYREPITVSVEGHEFEVHPGVFNPVAGSSTASLLAGMQIRPKSRVLDMGCGCGVVGIIAVHRGARSAVLADNNPKAAANAQANLARHGLEATCEAHTSDVFSALGGARFDTILFNAPFLFLAPGDADHVGADASPSAPPVDSYVDVGYQVLTRFFSGAADHLAPGGTIQSTFSSDGNQALLDQLLADHGFSKQILYQRPKPSGGTRMIYEYRPTPDPA